VSAIGSENTSAQLAELAAGAIDDKKGTEITILDVSRLLQIVDVFVIASGNSRRQVQTLAESVEERLRDLDRRPLRHEGMTEGEWVLLDYGDVVVHLFQPEARSYYSLERLWGDAPKIEWESVAS
jgi:ribosome-associated protein